jgi:serine/threonine-protein kinase
MAGSPPTPAPQPARIGRYEIQATLGKGAMGVVYRGFDPNIGRTVAIKTILLDSGDPEMIKRFRREAQAAGILNHPNIVTIYDAGEDQGVFYIAMELVEGETLHERIARGALSVEQATKIVEDVGTALDHAHTKQIIHRDIKPANIMLSGDRAKVMDFGVAKITSSALTTTGQIMGTPAYLSPEALKGEKADHRADIFALGVVLYEMLTGERPFAGDTIPTVIYKILSEQPQPITERNARLHPGLNLVLLRALAKNPADRYASCADFIRELKNFRTLGARPVETLRPLSPPPSPLATSSKPLPRPAPPPPPPPSGRVTAAQHVYRPPQKSYTKPALGLLALLAALAGAYLLWQSRHFWNRDTTPATTPPAAVAPAGKPSPARRPPARPAPAAAATTREIRVTANIEGAAVSVDGKTDPSWLTPATIALEPGAHRIRVAKAGYRPVTQVMNLTADSPPELAFHLQKLAEAAPPPPAGSAGPAPATPAATALGRLRVSSDPPDAMIMVDGELTRYRTPVNFELSPGRHVIGVGRGQGRVIRQVQIESGAIFDLHVNLKEGAAGRAEPPKKRFFPRLRPKG